MSTRNIPSGEEKSLKQRIRDGEIILGVGVSLDTGRSQLEEVLSQDNYDYLYIDGQHTAFNEDKLVAFCAMAEELDMPVHFRITHTRHAYLIGRYLDLGPTGIIVPEVKDEAIAEEASQAFYYPQVGQRSWGGTTRRGLKARSDRLTYAGWWNNYGVLCLQLESVEAITKARHLAKPGVDLFTFGPNDLTFSLEAHPHYPFQTVDDCIRHVAEQLQDSHVKLSISIDTPEAREKYLEMGVTVLQVRLNP